MSRQSFSNTRGPVVRNAAPENRLLSRDQATAIATKLLGMTRDRAIGVELEHSVRSLTRVANGRILTAYDGDEVAIRFQSSWGSGLPITIGTNQIDDATLERVVQQANAIATPLPDQPDRSSEDPKSFESYTYNAKQFPAVTIWHESTMRAMDEARDSVIPKIIDRARESKLIGAATLTLTGRASLFMYRPGLTAYSQETDSELTVTTRLPDGTASGWAGAAHRDWSKIDPDAVARKAIQVTNDSRNVVAMEPGRQVAILSPSAVGQLVLSMAPFFDAFMTDMGYTPFSDRKRRNKLGLKLFDERFEMRSDPADPEGGYPPFFEGGSPLSGFPIDKMAWVEKGVLKNLAYDVWYSLSRGKEANEHPNSVRLSGGTATVQDMIASCREGIYVNRFSNVSTMDEKLGLLNGVTRDGCFHVKDGKIDKPIKNFRFTDSPMYTFNSIEMIGVPERASLGYTPPRRGEFAYGEWPPIGRSGQLPRAPVIVPAMMVRDFNFVALAESV